jgi:putative SOS response-associated peptidase YedK
MCNLYSITSNQTSVRQLARAIKDITGNQPPLPGVFPDYVAPIVRNNQGSRELASARWGMPSPGIRAPGQKQRSRRHQHSQFEIPPLAALARH